MLSLRRTLAARRALISRRRFAAGVAVIGAGALAGTLAPTAPATAGFFDDAYGATVTVSVGAGAHATLPITLDLPAPGAGRRVKDLTFSWTPPLLTAPGDDIGAPDTYRAATPDCVPDATCHVTVDVPSATMTNGSPSIGIVVTATDGTTDTRAGYLSFWATVNNSKPAVAITSPTDRSTVWGKVTLAADAAPGPGGAPIKGVRFYIDPTARASDTYLFDDTAPYSVDVDAHDISSIVRSVGIVAIAEDVDGNLSPFAGYDSPMQHWVTVGPPPLVQWWTPIGQDRTAGSMQAGMFQALLGWKTSLPDTAPANPDNPVADPYIARVEVLMDGQPWADMASNNFPIWANFQNNVKWREASYSHGWAAGWGATAGRHTATLRVTTSYGAVASTDLRFVIGDGVVFSRVTSGDSTVDDGFVVTAGDGVPLHVTVSSKVPGAELVWWDATTADGHSLQSANGGCPLTESSICADSHTIDTVWNAPTTPGHYTVTFSGQGLGDPSPASITRTFVVQPRADLPAPVAAGALTASASRTVVGRGKKVTVSGRLSRTDNKHGVAGSRVILQWRAKGSASWTTVATVKSDGFGRVKATSSRSRTGVYRWTTNGIPGAAVLATSPLVRVTVR